MHVLRATARVLCVHVFVLLNVGHVVTVGQTTWMNFREDPEIKMNTTQLITSKGYPGEDHDVVTRDGYILTVQRIPHGLNDGPHREKAATRPVVLLQHGLFSCSACWVENLANESLGFMMADAGFDVWLGNSRGNTYARRHKTLNPKQKEFWDFSWDEMALLDMPATVDKILSITGASQIFFVGHSQGGGIGYAAMATNATLASKIKMFAPLAPAVIINHLTSPIRKLAPFTKDLVFLGELLGVSELLPNDAFFKFIARDVCVREIPKYLCENILFVIAGYDEKQMNASRIAVYLGQHPAGTSTQNMVHYAQMVNNNKFQRFDFGPEGNMKKYNQTTAPVYDLSKFNVPVILYHATNDTMVVQQDVAALVQATKHTIVSEKLIEGWEHLDFIWAMDAPSQCYNEVIGMFKKAA